MKLIPNYPNYYITEKGQVWSKLSHKWLKFGWDSFGYKRVKLYNKYGCKNWSVHILVLITFVGVRPHKAESRHLNGIKTDNRLENLCWGTRSENQIDRVNHKTNIPSKLTKQDVRTIIYMYKTRLFIQKEIAKVYNVSFSTISDIICKRIWKHLWTI